jgi:hypothetical protein
VIITSKLAEASPVFTGGDVSSDGGVLLLRQVDRRLGLVAALDAVLPDPRNPHFIIHWQVDLLRQRVYGCRKPISPGNTFPT